jgi:hypothetical protein
MFTSEFDLKFAKYISKVDVLLFFTCFWVSEFYVVLVEGLGHFESKMHKYVSYFRLIVLELRILCLFMMICYFY